MREHAQPSVPSLLVGIRQGDADALGQLFQLVYDELHALARIQRRRRPDSETLNTTALLHEAFIKLARADGLDLHDRAHFMAVAATAMRHVLLSDARRRTAAKRGPGKAPISFEEVERALENGAGSGDQNAEILLALGEALARLQEYSDRLMQVVDCRFFGGMSIDETARTLGVSPATVKRDWSLAQARLYRDMRETLK